MTDLEITKLCAEAMGLRPAPKRNIPLPPPSAPEAFRASPGKRADFWYLPLHDDAQAMALVKKFGLDLHRSFDGVWVVCLSTPKLSKQAAETESPDLNRAICGCVAKMEAPKVPA